MEHLQLPEGFVVPLLKSSWLRRYRLVVDGVVYRLFSHGDTWRLSFKRGGESIEVKVDSWASGQLYIVSVTVDGLKWNLAGRKALLDGWLKKSHLPKDMPQRLVKVLNAELEKLVEPLRKLRGEQVGRAEVSRIQAARLKGQKAARERSNFHAVLERVT